APGGAGRQRGDGLGEGERTAHPGRDLPETLDDVLPCRLGRADGAEPGARDRGRLWRGGGAGGGGHDRHHRRDRAGAPERRLAGGSLRGAARDVRGARRGAGWRGAADAPALPRHRGPGAGDGRVGLRLRLRLPRPPDRHLLAAGRLRPRLGRPLGRLVPGRRQPAGAGRLPVRHDPRVRHGGADRRRRQRRGHGDGAHDAETRVAGEGLTALRPIPTRIAHRSAAPSLLCADTLSQSVGPFKGAIALSHRFGLSHLDELHRHRAKVKRIDGAFLTQCYCASNLQVNRLTRFCCKGGRTAFVGIRLSKFCSCFTVKLGAEMSTPETSFGPFRFNAASRLLTEGEAPVQLGARALAILSALIETPGRLVSKAELLDRGWPGLNVDEANLRVQISGLRKALGKHKNLIRAEASLGYRFVGKVTTRYPSNRALAKRPFRVP